MLAHLQFLEASGYERSEFENDHIEQAADALEERAEERGRSDALRQPPPIVQVNLATHWVVPGDDRVERLNGKPAIVSTSGLPAPARTCRDRDVSRRQSGQDETMKTKVLRRALLSVAVVIVGVGAAGRAWSCVPQPLVTLQPQASGPSGSELTVDALAINGPAEIRWNGVDGQRLGDGTGPVFSAVVTIPEVPPGLYSIVVIERQADGSVGSTGRAAFQVTGPEPQSSPSSANGAVNNAITSHPGDSPGQSPVALLTVGAGLVALGGLGGALLFGRRRG